MVTETNTQSNYRYPGIRPFYDNDIDRRLFFGRDTEKETLLHKILADNPVVLYARSGLGKTSLLNAGLSQALRDREFIPLKVRFNDPGLDPVQWIYAGIKEIAKQKSIEIEIGEKATLWQYFKTTYFWSDSNKMLTPVLILDQFEEFFTLYSPGVRKGFIRQLADVVNDKIPASLLESLQPGEPLPYGDNPPNVKIIISIREDYVGQLDEMSREIPDILHHHFRLLPLSREQARQAIIKPSQVQDEVIGSASFTFATEAVDTMLDFLCKRRERGIIRMTDEVESFQLQLLCRHIEDMVREKKKKETTDIIVKEEDLGGEAGMQRVMQRFYDDQVEQLRPGAEKETVRKLCEEGLISITDRRLSLEEDEITRQFKVSKDLLQELVNLRLLRAEPRVGSVYYELSHDTLVVPIRESQKKRISKKNSINKLYEEANELGTSLDYDGAAQKYKDILNIDNTYVKAYLELGQVYYDRRDYNEATEIYNEAIKNGIKSALIFHQLGRALFSAGKTEEAIQSFEEAIGIDPNLFMPYEGLGDVYRSREDFKKAIKYYNEALNIDKNKPGIYRELAVSYIKAGETDKAIEIFQEAIKVNLDYKDIHKEIAKVAKEKGEQKSIHIIDMIYELANQSGSKKTSHYFNFNLGYSYGILKKYDEAIAAFQKTIEIDPKDARAYYNMGFSYGKQEKYDEAIAAFQKAIEIDPKDAMTYYNMGISFGKQEKYDEAIAAFQKAIKIDPKDAMAYYNIGISFGKQEKYDKAIAAFQKAIEIDPKYAATYYNLGNALGRQEKYDEAIAAFQKAIEIDPKYAYAYNNMGVALKNQEKYDEVITAFQKFIEIDPGHTGARANLAEAYLISGHFDDAFSKANDLLKEKYISTYHVLTMRFIAICSLVLQGQQSDAVDQLKDFIKYYNSIPGEYDREWEYNTIKTFITRYEKLPPAQKNLLLQLVDLLESPKQEGDKKLKELEIAIEETFQ
jgi:tetratricopeptide (TPR) repeat protein